MDDRLTVILTLKGREAWTPRWLDYHARVGLPWPVLIGDGAPSDETEALVASAKALRCQYLRFDDRSIRHHMRKLRSLIATAKTQYVFLSDNDDFLLPSGISRSADFLDSHSEYVSCGGAILGFHVLTKLLPGEGGAHGKVWHGLKPIYAPKVIDGRTAEERVLAALRQYYPTWNQLHRREALLAAFDAVAESEIDDYQVIELLVGLMLAAKGPQVEKWDCATYLRQLNSSQVNASLRNVLDRVFHGRLVRDVQQFADIVSEEVARIDGGDAGLVRPRLLDWVVRYFRQTESVGPQEPTILNAVLRLLRFGAHGVFARLPLLHAVSKAAKLAVARRMEIARTMDKLRSHGAASEELSRLRLEFEAAVESLMRPLDPESRMKRNGASPEMAAREARAG